MFSQLPHIFSQYCFLSKGFFKRRKRMDDHERWLRIGSSIYLGRKEIFFLQNNWEICFVGKWILASKEYIKIWDRKELFYVKKMVDLELLIGFYFSDVSFALWQTYINNTFKILKWNPKRVPHMSIEKITIYTLMPVMLIPAWDFRK